MGIFTRLNSVAIHMKLTLKSYSNPILNKGNNKYIELYLTTIYAEVLK